MSVLPDKSLKNSLTVWGALFLALGALLTGIGTEMVDGSFDLGEIINVIMKYGGPVATAIGTLLGIVGIRKKLATADPNMKAGE